MEVEVAVALVEEPLAVGMALPAPTVEAGAATNEPLKVGVVATATTGLELPDTTAGVAAEKWVSLLVR